MLTKLNHDQETNQYYPMIAKAIRYLSAKRALQPSLSDLSTYIGLSEYHLQRIFSEWAGVSPKQFLHYLTKEYAKQKLRDETMIETAFSCGLSGPSRLYDLMVNYEGMTPGEYKNLGKGLTIYYGSCASPFGQCFIATTNRGVCKLAFFDTKIEQIMLEKELCCEWEKALIVSDETKIKSLAQFIFSTKKDWKKPLRLLLKGSHFQLKVWEALLSIPESHLASYQTIASSIEKPTAVRAVASAVAKNRIAYLIPCHRIIKQNGDFGQYRWNKYRKQALIAWEACMQNPQT